MRDEGEQVHANSSSSELASKKSSAKLESGPSDVEYTKWPKFTSAQVSKHARLHDGWIIVHERVYDITSFAKTHPGFNNAGQVSTALAIARSLGKEATEEFTEIHSLTAWKQLRDFQIGVLAREGEDASNVVKEDDDNMEHVIPEWLKNDRDFWVRYSGGVDASVLRYLTKNGYPQEDDGDDDVGESNDDPEKNKNKNTKNTNTRKSATTKINIKILAFVVALGSSALRAAVKSNTGAKTSDRGEEHHRWVWEGNNSKLTSRAR